MKKELGIKEEEIKEPANNNNDQISFVVLNKSDFEDIKKLNYGKIIFSDLKKEKKEKNI